VRPELVLRREASVVRRAARRHELLRIRAGAITMNPCQELVCAQGHIEQPSGHEGCCEVGVTHCGCGWTGSSTTQQICPGLQQDTPQHVWSPAHALSAGSQGGVAQLPPMQVGVEAGQA
jgi:hypothetical protein